MTSPISLTQEERNLILAWRKLKQEQLFEAKQAIKEIPILINAISQHWDGDSANITEYKNPIDCISSLHRLMYDTVFLTETTDLKQTIKPK